MEITNIPVKVVEYKEKVVKLRFGDENMPSEPCTCGSRLFVSWEQVERGYEWDVDTQDYTDALEDGDSSERIEILCASCNALILEK